MSLKGGTAKQSSLGVKLAEGVFGKRGVIASVKQEIGKTLGSYEPDIFIEIEVDGGGEYKDRINLFGNFSREQTGPDEYNGPIKGWGTAGEIDRFFNRMGIFEDMPDDEKEIDTDTSPVTIPQAWMDAVQGVPIYYIVHASDVNPETGKPYYNAFKHVIPVEEDTDEEKQKAFKLMKEALYGDDYAFGKLQKGRDALDNNQDDSFDYGANVPDEPSSSGSLDDEFPI